MKNKDVKINVGGMYLELARAIANSNIEINPKSTDISGPNQLPNITKVNLHFTYSACAIIMGVASLEAHVNAFARGIFEGQFDNIEKAKWVGTNKHRETAESLVKFKDLYPDPESQNEFYRNIKLSKKVNLLYDAFSQERLCNSSDKEKRKLWEKFVNLEKMRHDLTHAKGQILEEKDSYGLFNKEPEEVQYLINTISGILIVMQKNLPLTTINAASNSVIKDVTLSYANKPMDEHILLTNTIYTPENKRRFGTR